MSASEAVPELEPVQTLKCMIVGDSKTGKTILFRRMMMEPDKNVPEEKECEYTPTVFDVANKEVTFKTKCEDEENESVNLQLTVTMWDSAGSNVFDTIRPISYAHTDCFIVCYSRNDPLSLENVEERWLPEIVRHGDGPTVPIILVEIDMKKGKEEWKECEETREKIKTMAQGFFQFFIKADKDSASEPDTHPGAILEKAVELAYMKKLEEGKPPDPIWKFYSMTVIIAGDCGVGKSSLIEKCIIQKSQTIKSPTSSHRKSQIRYQEYYHDLVLDGCEYFLRLLEIQLSPCGSADEILQLSKEADVLLLCYAINDPFSFQSVDQFSQNLSHLRSDLPIILIGTKCDLKETSDIIIPPEDGEALMLQFQLKCKAFMECSAISATTQSLTHALIEVCKESRRLREIKESQS